MEYVKSAISMTFFSLTAHLPIQNVFGGTLAHFGAAHSTLWVLLVPVTGSRCARHPPKVCNPQHQNVSQHHPFF